MTSNDVTVARRGSKINSLSKVGAITAISQILSTCHIIKGTRYIAEDGVVMSGLIYDRIMEKCPSITVEEVQLACREALFSDEDCYITPKDVMKWISRYFESDAYTSAQMAAKTIDITRQLAAPTKESVDAETLTAVKQMLRKDYDHYMEHGCFKKGRLPYFRGKYCYDYLVKMGKIKEDEWKQYEGQDRGYTNMFAAALDTPKEILAKAICVDKYLVRTVHEHK